MAGYEISVQDGHLHIQLSQVDDGWYARIDSDLEGAVFEGHVTELRDLLAGSPVPQSLAYLDDLEG